MANGQSGLSVKAAARVTGKSEASAKQLLEEARNYAKETGFSEAVDKVRRASREATFDTSDDASRRAMESIRASLDQSRQHTDQAAASYQQSLAFKEAATRARENSGAWEAGMLRQFVDWMGTQRNEQDLLGRNFNAGAVAQMAEKNPELLTPFVERFFKDRIEPNLSASVGEVKTAGDVQALFNQGKAGMPSASDIAGKGGKWLGQVKGAAAGAGVDPGKGVTSTVPQQVEAGMTAAGQAIDAGKVGVAAAGDPLVQKVTNQTAPGSQALLGLAATNAVGQVMPDGVSRSMMEKLPGVDTSVGTPGAAVAEAAAERSSAGQPRDPVLQTVTQGAQGVNDVLDRTVGYAQTQTGDVLNDTWAFGESKVGSLLGSSPKPGLPRTDADSQSGSEPGKGGETQPPSSR